MSVRIFFMYSLTNLDMSKFMLTEFSLLWLDHMVLNQKVNPFNYCYSSSNESKQTDQGDQGQPIKGRNAFFTQILMWYTLKLTEKRE